MANIAILTEAGWTAEDFDGQQSAVFDNDAVECRVVIDQDDDAFLLLGELESEQIQLYTMSGDLDAAFAVLSVESQMLDQESVPTMVKALAQTPIELTAADGIIVEPEHTDACDRLEIFREAFWQIFPFGDAEHAGAFAANDEVSVTVLESDEMAGWIVEFRDLEDAEGDDALAWQFDASDDLAKVLIDEQPELAMADVAALVDDLHPIRELKAI